MAAATVASMRRYQFITVDVFTSKPLQGNPLAVFTDARGLTDAEMQALAREMNLSETTFVIPRDEATERTQGIKVRIFTISFEMPFAGHPTLGTAFVLANARKTREVVLDLKVGPIPVRFDDREGRLFGEMTQRDPEFGQIHRAQDVAQAAGLPLDAIGGSIPIQTVTTGNPFAIVPLRSLAAIRALRINPMQAEQYLERTDAKLFYFVTREIEEPSARLHARMQFFGGEDPATGSAAGPAAAWMVRYGIAEPDEEVLIEQGIEAKRPSRIFVRASRDGERIHNVRVGGHVAEIIGGEAVLE
jgi:trans-2,3-dihydro-3-hydroxyanthranilate isomerase